MKTTRYTLMPVEVLWAYREFKRDEMQVPCIPFTVHHTIEEITDYVRINGLEPLNLSVVKDTALLTDGNHRIVAAKNLGLKYIPVNVTVYFGEGSDSFYMHTLNRFKPMTKELELQLKNVFLGEVEQDRDDNKNSYNSKWSN